MNTPGNQPSWSARGPLIVGFTALAVLIFGVGFWSVFANIAGAIVANGSVEVESSRQIVQHPDGGVVSEILVDDGIIVESGDVLMRLDGSKVRSDLKIIEDQLYEMVARRGRLSAERDGQDQIAFDAELTEAAAERDDVAGLIAGQVSLFDAGRKSLDDETAQLRERQTQIGKQIEGTEAQLAAISEQLELMTKQLEDQQGLLDQGLTEASKVLDLQRQKSGLMGSIGELTANIAESRGRIAEIEIEILKLKSGMRQESIATLREMQTRENELRERRAALRETLGRMEIRAPAAGIVYGLQVHAINAVIRPAEPIMFIVPQDSPLIVASRIDGINIDQVQLGQEAMLTFSSFNSRTTPQIMGRVTNVSADVFNDERTGQVYYAAEITPDEGELQKLEGLVILPGMPVTAFIQTGNRSALSYLLRPFTDYFNKAFRET